MEKVKTVKIEDWTDIQEFATMHQLILFDGCFYVGKTFDPEDITSYFFTYFWEKED